MTLFSLDNHVSYDRNSFIVASITLLSVVIAVFKVSLSETECCKSETSEHDSVDKRVITVFLFEAFGLRLERRVECLL